MPDASYVQTSFLGGEWSAFYQGRMDHPKYRTAMAVCLNNIVLEEGACVRRPGTRHVVTTEGQGKAGRVIDATFTQSAPYVLEFTDGNIRIINGTVLVKEIDYSGISTVDVTQSPAVVTLLSPRTSWTVGTEVVFLFQNANTTLDGVALRNRVYKIATIDSTGLLITLTDANTGNAINGTDITWGTELLADMARVKVLASPYTGGNWANTRVVKDGTNTTLVLLNGTVSPRAILHTPNPCGPDFAGFQFELGASSDPCNPIALFQDGPYLDHVKGSLITPAGISQSLTLTVSNQAWVSTTVYGLGDLVSASGVSYQSLVSTNIGNTPASSPTYWQVVPAARSVGPNGFLSTDLGRVMRLHSEPPVWNIGTAYTVGQSVSFNDSTANVYYTCIAANTGQQPDLNIASWQINTSAATWTWGVITEIVTPSEVVLAVLGPAILYNAVMTEWQMGVYSDTTGWPTCGCFHEGRLWVGSKTLNRIDSSYSNDIFNFAPTAADGTVTDANAISVVFDDDGANNVLWLTPAHNGIVGGTEEGEWLIQASTLQDPLTPSTTTVKKVTSYGCADIEPVKTGISVVFVQRFKRKALELITDVFTGRYTAPNLSVAARHMSQGGFAELRYQQERTPIVWARTASGSLVGCSYRRVSSFATEDPSFVGWHRHTLGSGRTVESITVAPGPDGLQDLLYMVTNDPATNVRHVEVMTEILEEDAPFGEAWYCDDAITPTGSLTTSTGVTLYGLWHVIGKTVSVNAGGLDVGDYTVASNGTITVPFTSTFTSTFLTSTLASGETYGSMAVLLDEDVSYANEPVFPTGSKLWVAGSSCEVMEWPFTATGNTAPTINIQGSATTLTGPLRSDKSFTYAVDIDADGYQYALEYWAVTGTPGTQYAVATFAPGVTGNVAPVRRFIIENEPIVGTNLELPAGGLCVDGSKNIYVALYHTIYKFNAGSNGNTTGTVFVKPSSIWNIVGTAIGISSLTFDPVRNWIWATYGMNDADVQPAVVAYDLDGNLQVEIDYSGFVQPMQSAIGPDGSVYVADAFAGPDSTGAVFIFGPNVACANDITTPVRTLYESAGLWNRDYLGIAVDADGVIYLSVGDTGSSSGYGHIYSYPSTSNGDVHGTNLTDINGAGTYLVNMIDGAVTFPVQLRIQNVYTGNGHVCSDLRDTIPIVAGFTYTSQGQALRPVNPQEAGAANGPAFAKTRRDHQYGILVENAITGSISIGTDFNHLWPANFKYPGETAYTVLEPYSDIHWNTADDTYTFDSKLSWQITRPLPANVLAIGGFLNTQDR